MSSSELVEALEILQPFVYGGLFLGAFIQWRRRPVRAGAWLVAAFGALALVIVAGRLLPEDSTAPAVVWAGKALIAILVLFPYFLYRFMNALIRPIPWVKVTASVLTVTVAIAGFLLPDFPESGEPRSALFTAFITVFLIQWVFVCGVVALGLWRAGRGQPTVARRRMRTMSLGAAGLALALVVAGEFSNGDAASLLVQLLVLGAAPLMLVGFAPPRMLRVAWRRREETAMKDAGLSLMEATTISEVAQTLLPHARRLVGAAAAVLEDSDGEIIATDGLDDEEVRTIIGSSEDGSAFGGALNGSLVTVPMRTGRLVVVANPFTPFFGHDELSELEGLAALADLALARNRLLDSQRRLGAIVESSDDAIISKTLDGTITSWNRGAERMYGYGPEEVIGKPISILVPAELQDEVPAILQKVRNNQSIEHYETQRLTKDGRTIDVSLTISPIRDAAGNLEGASTIARDVSERRKMEQERESAREEADRANLAKSEFLSRMSHELRTPLNAVLGFAQLLEMDHLTPEQEEGTREILKAGKHLLELVNEVIDISRIEAGKLRLSLEPVDAVLLAEECISLLIPFASEEGVSLSMDRHDASGPVPYVTADRQRLRQVLLNLISNGIKYNRQHGSVRVSFEPTDKGHRLRIDVTDTGRGIPSERIDELFAPFERLGADAWGIEGTGLGLALSRPLVEAMGGTITVSSELGMGSTFSVELASAEGSPMRAEDETSSREETMAGSAATSRKVLYIEDNLSNLKLVERLVARRSGIVLMSAMQGGIGVTLARDHLPDLILLDLNLPDMPGEEVLSRLQADPRTADLPVVVISADATKGQRRRLLHAGAREYVAKPIDVSHFLRIVDELLREPGAAHVPAS
jgi:PAS domain S-box-containing protein